MDGIGSIIITLVMLSVMLSAHELGHFITAKRAGIKVEEFGYGFPPRIWAIRRGETEYSINLIPFACFVRMAGEDNPNEERSLAAAKKRWRVLVLVAGSAMNLILAALLFAGAFMVGFPTVVESEVAVSKVVAGSPAEQAGLQTDDVILAVAGVKIVDVEELRDQIQANAGQPVSLDIRRDTTPMTVTLTPRTNVPADQGPMGVAIWNKPTKIEPKSYDPLTALWMGTQRTGEVLWMTVRVPVMILEGQLPAELARPVGIVGIFQVTNQAATATVDQSWAFPLLNVLAVLSAGLGFANLLPIPGLDGGRLLFVVVEAIRRRRVEPELEGKIHFAGIMLLFGLMAVMIYVDLMFPIGNLNWTP